MSGLATVHRWMNQSSIFLTLSRWKNVIFDSNHSLIFPPARLQTKENARWTGKKMAGHA
jgi:hypothetical protein